MVLVTPPNGWHASRWRRWLLTALDTCRACPVDVPAGRACLGGRESRAHAGVAPSGAPVDCRVAERPPPLSSPGLLQRTGCCVVAREWWRLKAARRHEKGRRRSDADHHSGAICRVELATLRTGIWRRIQPALALARRRAEIRRTPGVRRGRRSAVRCRCRDTHGSSEL